ncbi:winged helix-turn-helix transcriptional regulator [Streptomyces collinus]|uniref:winged helix-turn-helix transcriptional regulator n=1 Tax=Streptomyces collinus TaxID=42684 RepID=UPI0036E47358
MIQYGQFCAIARALEILGERWTLLIVRELMLGEGRFNDIRRGLPRISPSVLSSRLKALEKFGIIETCDKGYRLTESGAGLAPVIAAMGGWAMRWDRRGLLPTHLDPDVLVRDVSRRLNVNLLPRIPTLVELKFLGRAERYFLHIARPYVAVCSDDGGQEVALSVTADLQSMTRYWIGELTWEYLLRSRKVELVGPTALQREFPTWFSGYLLANHSDEAG